MSRVFIPIPRPGAFGWRQMLVAALLLGSIPLSWWLFGPRVENVDGVGIVTERRFFGRVTVRTVDANRDGHVDGRYEYHWSAPATEPGARPYAYAEDRNFDGKMDVWVTDLGPDAEGRRELRYDVDTDDDGKPDWSFKTLDTLSADQAVVERRGW